jgi:hypothetical protein
LNNRSRAPETGTMDKKALIGKAIY